MVYNGPGFPQSPFSTGYGGDQGSFAPPSGPPPGYGTPPSFPSHEPAPSFPSHETPPSFPAHDVPPSFPSHEQPPAFPSHERSLSNPAATQLSPAGQRIALTTQAAFPFDAAGPAPAQDMDGSAVYVGSARFEKSVHPCKIVPRLAPTPCRVPYGGGEYEHHGDYDLLPIDTALMEWVPTSQGRLPVGRRLVVGGQEEHGAMLYHAMATVNGVLVPGKTAEHLGGANVAFGGAEHVERDNYSILCWKN